MTNKTKSELRSFIKKGLHKGRKISSIAEMFNVAEVTVKRYIKYFGKSNE